MSSSWDTLSDVLGYLIVVSVMFAFSIGLTIYMAYEILEQIFRTDARKPIPGLRFRQPSATAVLQPEVPSVVPINQRLEPPGEEPHRAA